MYIVSNLYNKISGFAEWMTLSYIKKNFFCGFKKPSDKIIAERQRELQFKGGIPFQNGGAYFIPAKGNTDKTVLIAHTRSFWQLHPKHYDHLLEGRANVILFDPTELTTCQYQADLEAVIQDAQSLFRDQTSKITIYAHCATVDPAIGAAAKLQDPNIDLILDRGHGNVEALAYSMTRLAAISSVKSILNQYFNCHGEQLIQSVAGKILFIHAQNDQLMKTRKHDLMQNLQKSRSNKVGDEVVQLKNGDHWSHWDQETAGKVQRFIGTENPDLRPFPQTVSPPSCTARTILHYLMHLTGG